MECAWLRIILVARTRLLSWTYLLKLNSLRSGFPGSSVGQESACNAGDPSSVPGWGREPGVFLVLPVAQMVKTLSAMLQTWVWSLGLDDPRQEGMASHCRILAWRIPMNRGAWWATGHGVAKSQTWLRLGRAQRKIGLLFSRQVVFRPLQLHGLQNARPPVPHHLLESAHVHVHCTDDAIQPSHPLSVSH